ncbi:MAG TPA: nucleotidyltransferase domain-containing protein [Flavisolibacter sp.]
MGLPVHPLFQRPKSQPEAPGGAGIRTTLIPHIETKNLTASGVFCFCLYLNFKKAKYSVPCKKTDMPTDNHYIQQLKEKLKELNPYKVILFGSYAYGTPHVDSDIDLLVVTNDQFIPHTFKEKTNLYISVSEQILNISKQVPVDLIVYTLPMYEQFIEAGSSFSKEILSKGIVIYETKHTTMA